MTALLFLVRHASHSELGHRLTGRGGGGLTPMGERQAAVLAERLEKEEIVVIHTSPRDRCLATAEAIAQRSGAPVEVVPQLDEIDFGDWTGASFDALESDPRWNEWNRARGTSCPPNGETMAAAAARMITHIEETAETHSGSSIALVSHCDMIRGVVAHYMGLPLDHILRFDISPASISRLRVGRWGAQIINVNETAA